MITDDTVFEDFELFMVRLTALTPYVILSPNDAVVGIIDDDGQFVLVCVCVQDANYPFPTFR